MDLNEIQSLSSSNLETSQSDDEDENENNAKQDELKNKTNNNLDRGFIESSHKCKQIIVRLLNYFVFIAKTNNTRSSVSLKQLIDLKEEIVEPKWQDIFAEKESTIRHEDESAATSNMSISKLLPPIVNHFNNSK